MRRLILSSVLALAGGAQALQLHLLPPKSTDVVAWREAGFTVRASGSMILAVGDDDRVPPQNAIRLEVPDGWQPHVRHSHGHDEALPDPLPEGVRLLSRGESMQLFVVDPARLPSLEALHLFPLVPPPRGRTIGRELRLRSDKRVDTTVKAEIVAAVSGTSVHDHLSDLIDAAGDRNTYGVGDEAAADHLETVLSGFGYTVQRQTFIHQSPHVVHNVIAVKPGTLVPEEIVVVGAHYDAIASRDHPQPLGPALGAEDNGSGTASVLHLAEIFADYETDRTIHFILFGMEEQGLHGSRYYANNAVANDWDVIGALTMDMMAAWTNNYRMTIEGWNATYGDPGSQELMNLVDANATQYSPGLQTTQYVPGFASDHEPFHDAGIPAMLAIETDYGIYSGYHRSSDTLANPSLDFDFAEDVVRAMAGALVDLSGPRSIAVALSGLRATQEGSQVLLRWHATLSGDEMLTLTRHHEDGRRVRVLELAATQGWMEAQDQLERAFDGELLRYELSAADGVTASTALQFRSGTQFALAQNRPNPFRAAEGTQIALTLGRAARIDVAIYDVSGRRVRTLEQGELAAGLRQLHWDGRDQEGRVVAAGVYFARLRAGERLLSKRLTVLR